LQDLDFAQIQSSLPKLKFYLKAPIYMFTEHYRQLVNFTQSMVHTGSLFTCTQKWPFWRASFCPAIRAK